MQEFSALCLKNTCWVNAVVFPSACVANAYNSRFALIRNRIEFVTEQRRQTKIIATLGPATDDPDVLRRLEGGAFAPLRAPEADRGDARDEKKKTSRGEDEKNASSREETAFSVARDVLVGMAAGGQILQVVPFSLARQGPLGGPAGATLARRIETWRRATGNAGDAIVYLVDLEGFEQFAAEGVADDARGDVLTATETRPRLHRHCPVGTARWRRATGSDPDPEPIGIVPDSIAIGSDPDPVPSAFVPDPVATDPDPDSTSCGFMPNPVATGSDPGRVRATRKCFRAALGSP